MTRRTPNNPSGKYIRMNDEQVAREQAKFDRAVERQAAKDRAAAAASKARIARAAKPRCESGWTGDRCSFPLFHEGPHSNE